MGLAMSWVPKNSMGVINEGTVPVLFAPFHVVNITGLQDARTHQTISSSNKYSSYCDDNWG